MFVNRLCSAKAVALRPKILRLMKPNDIAFPVIIVGDAIPESLDPHQRVGKILNDQPRIDPEENVKWSAL